MTWLKWDWVECWFFICYQAKLNLHGEGHRITEPNPVPGRALTDMTVPLSCLLALQDSVTASTFLSGKQIFFIRIDYVPGENIKETTLESLQSQSQKNLELLLFFLNMCAYFHISHSWAKVLRNGKAGEASSVQSGITTKSLLEGCTFFQQLFLLRSNLFRIWLGPWSSPGAKYLLIFVLAEKIPFSPPQMRTICSGIEDGFAL